MRAYDGPAPVGDGSVLKTYGSSKNRRHERSLGNSWSVQWTMMVVAGDKRAVPLRWWGAVGRFVAVSAPLLSLGACTFVATPDQNTCSLDPSVDCSSIGGGYDGYTCTGTDTPDQDFSVSCAAAANNSDGSTSYCCAGGTDTCAPDATVSCNGQGDGYTCTGSDTPAQDFSGIQCGSSTRNPDGSTSYCCSSSTTCAPDSSVNCTNGGGFGFTCTGSDTPDADFTGLTCSSGTVASVGTSYCCNGCVQDSSVDCSSGGGTGYACSGSSAPDASLNCSTGTPDPNTGNMDYCCGQ